MWMLLSSLALGSEVMERHAADFAEEVGDVQTYELIRRHQRLSRGVGMVGWIGGGVYMGVGGLTSLVGVAAGDGDIALAGFAVAGAGAAAFTAGTSAYVLGKLHYRRMSTWYTPMEAQAWVDSLPPPLEIEASTTVELVWNERSGLVADIGGRPIHAERFALEVGDQQTWRRVRAWKWMNTAAGVGLCGAGYLMTSTGLGMGDERGLLVATGGVASVGTGVLLLTLGRRVYTDMDTWYTRQEAESWLEGGP